MGDVSLTLNQDKRRRFDSYPGSISAGGALLALAERAEQEGDCTLECALVATRAHADDLSVAAYLVARELGQSVQSASQVRAFTYAEAVA